MKITVIISALLIAQVSASFFDAFQGAVLSVQNSFGKLLSDVVTDVKETVDCTLLAVEHVLALSEDATTRYYKQCGSGTADDPTVNDTQTTETSAPKVDVTFEIVNANNEREEIKNVSSSDLGAKINETILELLNKFSAQDKLNSVGNVLAEETKQIVNVSDQVKTQLERFTKVNLSDLSTSDRSNSKPSVDTVLQEIKLLEKRERNTDNSSESAQIHRIIDEILNRLDVISATEASENEKIEHILIDIEKESNTSITSLKKEFEEWKVKESVHLKDIKNHIEERDVLNNHTQVSEPVFSEQNIDVINNSTTNVNLIPNTITVSYESPILDTSNETYVSRTSLPTTTKVSTSTNFIASENAIISNIVSTITPFTNSNIQNVTGANDRIISELNRNDTIQATQLDKEFSNSSNAVTISYSVFKNMSNFTESKYEIENVKDPPIKNTTLNIIRKSLSNHDTINATKTSSLLSNMSISSINSSFSNNTENIVASNKFYSTMKAANDSSIIHNSSDHSAMTTFIQQESEVILNSEDKAQEKVSFSSNETETGNVLWNYTITLNDTQHTSTSVLKEFNKNSTDFANTTISTLINFMNTNVTSNASIADLIESVHTLANSTVFQNDTFTEPQNNTQINDNLQQTYGIIQNSEVIQQASYVQHASSGSNETANFFTNQNVTIARSLNDINRNSTSDLKEVNTNSNKFANTTESTLSNFVTTNVASNTSSSETIYTSKNNASTEAHSSMQVNELSTVNFSARNLDNSQLNSTLFLKKPNDEISNTTASTTSTLGYFMNKNDSFNISMANVNQNIQNDTFAKANLHDTQLKDHSESTSTTVPTTHTTNESSILQQNTTMEDNSLQKLNVTTKDLTEVKEVQASRVVVNETAASNMAEKISVNNTRNLLSNLHLEKEFLKKIPTQFVETNVTDTSPSTTSNTHQTSTPKMNENVTEFIEIMPTITKSETLTLKSSLGQIEMKYENVITTSKSTKSAEEEISTININRLTPETSKKLASNSSTYTAKPLKTVLSEVIRSSNSSDESNPTNLSQDDHPLSLDNYTNSVETTVVNTPYTDVPSADSAYIVKNSTDKISISTKLNESVTKIPRTSNVTKEIGTYSPKPKDTSKQEAQTLETITIPYSVQKDIDTIIKDTDPTNILEHLIHGNGTFGANAIESTTIYNNIPNNKTASLDSQITTNPMSAVSSQNNQQIVMISSNQHLFHSENQRYLSNNDVPIKPILEMPRLEPVTMVKQPAINTPATIEINNLYPPKINSIDTNNLPQNIGIKKAVDINTGSYFSTPISKQPVVDRNSNPIPNDNDNTPQINPSEENPINDISTFFSRASSNRSAGNSLRSLNGPNYQNVDNFRNNPVDVNPTPNRLIGSKRQEMKENDQFQSRNFVNTKKTSSLKTIDSNLQPQLERSASSNLYIPPNPRETRAAITTLRPRHHHSYPPSEVQARQKALKDARQLISSSRQQDHVLNSIRKNRNRARSVFN